VIAPLDPARGDEEDEGMLGLAAGPGTRRLTLLLAFAVVGPAAQVPVAEAGDVSVRDRGSVKSKGLTRAERSALDVQRVRARGAKIGLFVTVRFKGDFAGRIGRGRLKRALAALVLHPKGPKRKPSILATTGPAGKARTLRGTRSTDVGALREGRQVTFFIVGGGLAGVKRIEVKVFRARPRGSRRVRAAQLQLLPDEFGRAILEAEADDETGLGTPSLSDEEFCRALLGDYKLNRRLLDERLDESNREATGKGNTRPRKELDQTIADLGRLVRSLRTQLVRAGCIRYGVSAIGFEHGSGETVVCLDVSYNDGDGVLRSFDLLGLEVFRRQSDGSFVKLQPQAGAQLQPSEFRPGGDLLDPVGRRLRFTINVLGTYKVVVKDKDFPAPVEGSTEVPAPPPQATKDC
jgi:hypothetical protein